jgi:hypothetical protein
MFAACSNRERERGVCTFNFRYLPIHVPHVSNGRSLQGFQPCYCFKSAVDLASSGNKSPHLDILVGGMGRKHVRTIAIRLWSSMTSSGQFTFTLLSVVEILH